MKIAGICAGGAGINVTAITGTVDLGFGLVYQTNIAPLAVV